MSEPVKTKWPVSYYEGAVEGAEEEVGRLVEDAASVASRIGQFRVAVGDIAARDAEITRLRAEVKRLTGERDELAANGAAIVGALEERDMARAERDEARARIRDLEAALRETHDALERLDAIHASEHDPDPVLGTVLRPAWLADALRHARTLLTPTAPDGGERVTMTIDVDALSAAPTVQCIRCNAPCSECATPTQKGAAK